MMTVLIKDADFADRARSRRARGLIGARARAREPAVFCRGRPRERVCGSAVRRREHRSVRRHVAPGTTTTILIVRRGDPTQRFCRRWIRDLVRDRADRPASASARHEFAARAISARRCVPVCAGANPNGSGGLRDVPLSPSRSSRSPRERGPAGHLAGWQRAGGANEVGAFTAVRLSACQRAQPPDQGQRPTPGCRGVPGGNDQKRSTDPSHARRDRRFSRPRSSCPPARNTSSMTNRSSSSPELPKTFASTPTEAARALRCLLAGDPMPLAGLLGLGTPATSSSRWAPASACWTNYSPSRRAFTRLLARLSIPVAGSGKACVVDVAALDAALARVAAGNQNGGARHAAAPPPEDREPQLRAALGLAPGKAGR